MGGWCLEPGSPVGVTVTRGRPATCRGEMRTCGSGECLLRRYVCDGHRDCLDGSDELDCGENYHLDRFDLFLRIAMLGLYAFWRFKIVLVIQHYHLLQHSYLFLFPFLLFVLSSVLFSILFINLFFIIISFVSSPCTTSLSVYISLSLYIYYFCFSLSFYLCLFISISIFRKNKIRLT